MTLDHALTRRARPPRRRTRSGDAGETLVEIVLTVLVIGITVTALVSALATSAAAGASHRDSVRADTVIRNYAESVKAAADTCTAGGTYHVDFTPPTGYVATISPTGGTCPAVTTTQLVTLQVTTPVGIAHTMQIRIRTP